jgi:hypothetical protein
MSFAAASIVSASGALAQSKSPAEAQYEWGLAEMRAGHYASGCPALAESYKLDPLPGALFTLAECENKWGKLATALAHYAAYLDAFSRMTAKEKVGQVGRDQIAAVQRERLEREAPHLTLTLGAVAPQGTTIRRDGERVGAPSLGVALPLDPGDHVITAETEDGRRFEKQLTLSKGERQTLLIEFVPSSAAVAPPPLTPPTVNSPSPPARTIVDPARERPAPASPSPSKPSRTWIYATGAIGIAGVTVGAVAGVLTLLNKTTIDQHCGLDGNATSCDAQGKTAADASRVSGLVSDIGFGVGAAGLVAAVILWVTQPRPAASARGIVPVISGDPSRRLFAGLRATW